MQEVVQLREQLVEMRDTVLAGRQSVDSSLTMASRALGASGGWTTCRFERLVLFKRLFPCVRNSLTPCCAPFRLQASCQPSGQTSSDKPASCERQRPTELEWCDVRTSGQA